MTGVTLDAVSDLTFKLVAKRSQEHFKQRTRLSIPDPRQALQSSVHSDSRALRAQLSHPAF